MTVYKRDVAGRLLSRLGEKRRFIQVLAGPRQVGKTTAIRQAMEALDLPSRYMTADTPEIKDLAWLQTAWESGRQMAGQQPSVLALDEIQKIPGWADAGRAGTGNLFPICNMFTSRMYEHIREIR